VKHPKTKEYDLSSVINIASGAAPLGADVGKEFEALWPKGQVNMKVCPNDQLCAPLRF